MSLFDNYEETVAFINLIREIIFVDELFVFLNFSECEEISAETCVVLAAEIDRCNKKEPKSIIGSYPDDSDVYFMLNELGFFQLLGIKSSKPAFDELPEVDVVRLKYGSDNPESLMRGIKELFYEDGVKPASPYSGKIYRALTEAMANAVEHAYPEVYKDENHVTCIPVWWRAGFKLNDNNTIVMVLYDQGAGIPNTLKVNWNEKLEELTSKLMREPYDDEKLSFAMSQGRSSTKVQGRGQGSYDMQQLIRESSDGVLSIFSYKGAYSFDDEGNWEAKNVNATLYGTLVVWSICLNTCE